MYNAQRTFTNLPEKTHRIQQKKKWPDAIKKKFTKEHTQMANIHKGLKLINREGNMNLNHKIYSYGYQIAKAK